MSSYLDKAQEILEGVRGKPQTLDERKRLSIELCALMLRQAAQEMTSQERAVQQKLARLMRDPVGKAFTTAMTDQCFRSSSPYRVADQLIYLLNLMGVPQYLDVVKRLELHVFKLMGPQLAQLLVPLAMRELRRETARVILPAEREALSRHLQERRRQSVRLNLNHLGEAILSEEEAQARMALYLDDLAHPDIDYISVKISTVYSQLHLIAFSHTVDAICERMKVLYRAAMQSNPHKFVNLDMEEYRDLALTVVSFKKTLDEPEFHNTSAGIVLQAYLPDSFAIQKELTEWAQRRVRNGGAPIKIRIVKGANLSMEQFEASLREWPQAPYTGKVEVDANYKRMVSYGLLPESARAVRIGVASHNLFDIAFALLLRCEHQVESYVGFEMLEGMADHMRRVVQTLAGDMLLYCPVAAKEEFQHAIAYLIRRLDENTGAENFLRHVFQLRPGSEAWDAQCALFAQSCEEIATLAAEPRRQQNRLAHPTPPADLHTPFENEPDTDFALPQNQRWAEEIARHWQAHRPKPLPLVIEGAEVAANESGIGRDPSQGGEPIYRYAKAEREHAERALQCAKTYEATWAATSLEHRCSLLASAAQKLRERRGEIIGASMLDGGKTIVEADVEVSEAIDFAEYYRRQMQKMTAFADLQWRPKGTILVTPPWNFPSSIPAGGIFAALIAGNCVILKPASDSVLIAWHLIHALWDAGIPKEALQFLPCSGEEVGSVLVCDPRVDAVIFTGGTDTARKLLQMRPGLDLAAETGGKNSMIVTALADRDLAIKDLLQSAFGHSGQKCSAASLAILEAELYDDPRFLAHLRHAAASLTVGIPWHLPTKVNPLIHEPRGPLLRALTSLEPGEEWLLEPRRDPHNPCLWSPGIKLHVQPGNFTHMTELFGPVLGLLRARNLAHAVELANAVPYGLTSGLHSLDEREQAYWIHHIEAGNLYINRGITGAIVRRQPFGGTKASSFGNGSKAGGPNYLRECLHVSQVGLPQHKHPTDARVNSLTAYLDAIDLTAEQLGLWTASVANYAYWWKRMRQDRDPSKIVGQDNFFRYLPRHNMILRITPNAHPLDALRAIAAALTCNASLTLSWTGSGPFPWNDLAPLLPIHAETDDAFCQCLHSGSFHRVRLLEPPTPALNQAASASATLLIHAPVLANGRFELLHYLRELSLSIDYHRYGNLGLREGELRKPIL